ncbi:phage major capsid protein [Clostridium perfringens]|uniref:phage major capsid protein n=1 Tax=Clostridium perfringens TaxID=1502 RepID=UPI0028650889|nr:phage major capsid protein [Clostridium perfringens]MDU3583802.1 phage major capsid protein [Clostridium butyricum]
MRIDELKEQVKTLTGEVRSLIDAKDIDGAKAKREELRQAKEMLALEEDLEQEEIRDLQKQKEERKDDVKMENREQQTAKELRAIIKVASGKSINEEERALLANNGQNGEGYILPQTVSTKIVELIRQYKSLRDVVGHMTTSTLTGSFPIENFETVSGLVDFVEDGTNELTESKDIKFKNVSYTLKEKGAFIALSNTLLNMTDNDLINYVAKVFAKKAIITENKMAIETLGKGKSKKALADWKSLKKSLNVDLDPAVLYGCLIVTNQDGFAFLDSLEDKMGRPILQSDPTNPTKKMFNGYKIEVFSNTMLPTVDKKAPIIYGNLEEAVKFVDNGKYSFATSDQAGFLKNVTYARIIEHVDCVQIDNSDKLYCYGELSIEEPASK